MKKNLQKLRFKDSYGYCCDKNRQYKDNDLLHDSTCGTGCWALADVSGQCGNSDSVPWGCHWGAGWLGCSVGTSEPFGRGLDTVALGGPPVFTSELIGEDSLAGH